LKPFLFLFFILCCGISFSCNENDKLEIERSASAFDLKQGEASILQSNQNFMKAFKNHDSIEVSNAFATDGKVMSAHQPSVEGRENILHFFAKQMQSGINEIDLNTIKIWGDSSLLIEEGNYRFSGKSEEQSDKGKYIVLWKMEAGNWKMYRDIWTTDLPSSSIQLKKITLPKP
jgi:ketosteroid isomerase-like protein